MKNNTKNFNAFANRKITVELKKKKIIQSEKAGKEEPRNNNNKKRDIMVDVNSASHHIKC